MIIMNFNSQSSVRLKVDVRHYNNNWEITKCWSKDKDRHLSTS